jgi:hypothetical protein
MKNLFCLFQKELWCRAFFLIFISGTLLLLPGCFKKAPVLSDSPIPDHTLLDTLLIKYVDENGLIDYDGFKSDKRFEEYLNELRSHPPDSTWSNRNKLAYWLNVYNAFTIKLIADHLPLESIRDITPVNFNYLISSWQIKFIDIGDEIYCLDDIKHGIIRKEFNQARAYFGLLYATQSGPGLRREAYRGFMLDMQLSDQLRDFLMDKRKNELTADHIKLSKIFKWYEGDFSQEGTIIQFINKFSPIMVKSDAKVEYLDYDWNLGIVNSY